MVIMAGMLPGVECARRRRLRHHPSGEAPPRRASLCLYASGRDLGSSSSSSSSSAACSKDTVVARASWTLDSSAREAKERLDQKLRGHREPVVTRHQMSTRPPPAKPHLATCTLGGGTDGDGLHGERPAAAPCVVLQREVVPSKKGGGRGRFSWCRRLVGRCGASQPEAEAEAECAVCLEELRAGDVAAHLPCAHRFHWSCAVPWVQAASRCPVCRAIVHAHPAAAAASS